MMWPVSGGAIYPHTRFWPLLLLLPTALCLSGQQLPADYGLNPRYHPDAPQSRLIFNPFNIFGNPKCSYNGNEGVCYGEVECLALAGNFGNFCDGLVTGLCCLFLRTCEMRTSQEVSYFRNVQYPLADKAQEQCTFKVVKQSAEYCGLKLDMEKFELPSDGETSLVITEIKDDTLPPLIGSHTGQTYQFDIREVDEIYFNVKSSSGDSASWNIKNTQIRCSDWTSEILPGSGTKVGGSGGTDGTDGTETGGTDGTETGGLVGPDGAFPTVRPPTTTTSAVISAKPPAPPTTSTTTTSTTTTTTTTTTPITTIPTTTETPETPAPAPVPTTDPPIPSPPAPPPSSSDKCGVKGPDFNNRRSNIDKFISSFDDDSSHNMEREPRRESTNKNKNRRRKNNKKRPQGPDLIRPATSKQQVPFLTNNLWDVPVLNDTLFWQWMGPLAIFQGRITYGKLAGQREYPWQVAMKVHGRFHCGATIIGKRHVLTAAHCVTSYRDKPRTIQLSIGDWDLEQTVDNAHQTPSVSRVKVHERYSRTTLQNDIAVLTLEEDIEFAPHIAPICLPRSDLSPEGESAIVTGWGRNQKGTLQAQLHELQSEVVSNVLCDIQWRKNGAPVGFIVGSMMCLEAVGGDSCNGDSGGPSVLEIPKGSGTYVQIGIVSFGSASCTDENLPGVYTRVTSYLDWINQEMSR